MPAEKELSTPTEMSSAVPLCEKTVRTPMPMAIPLCVSADVYSLRLVGIHGRDKLHVSDSPTAFGTSSL